MAGGRVASIRSLPPGGGAAVEVRAALAEAREALAGQPALDPVSADELVLIDGFLAPRTSSRSRLSTRRRSSPRSSTVRFLASPPPERDLAAAWEFSDPPGLPEEERLGVKRSRTDPGFAAAELLTTSPECTSSKTTVRRVGCERRCVMRSRSSPSSSFRSTSPQTPPGIEPLDVSWCATSRNPAGTLGACSFPSFGPYEASQTWEAPEVVGAARAVQVVGVGVEDRPLADRLLDRLEEGNCLVAVGRLLLVVADGQQVAGLEVEA